MTIYMELLQKILMVEDVEGFIHKMMLKNIIM